jgi:WD40 repeat protein/tetratricopeptide (TPR) repeat protein/tRNA A-37 threonylcarbamoyl transferase component Bud32
MRRQECVGEPELRRLLRGELPEPVAQAITQHLESCPHCEQTARRLDGEADPFLNSLRQAVVADCGSEVSSGLNTTTAPTTVTEMEGLTAVAGYEVLGELGRGGTGVVYKARQARPARVVALKLLLGASGAGAERQARLLAEADALARLQHPHIVQVFEVGRHQGTPFVVLEYMAGGSLAQRLGGAPQPAREAARLAECLTRAVEHAHAQRVVHRDLKPANVLLTENGTPKVSDFGLAKADRPDLTATGAILGTPSYMAPEQAAGASRDTGPAADVYALGAILYELLTGRPPFRAATVLETLEQVRHQEPVAVRQLQPKVPRDLETICHKCLQKEPGSRYAGARELAEDLGRFLGGQPVRARPVGPVERAARWCRRRPGWAAMLTTVAALLLVIAVGGTHLTLSLREKTLDLQEKLWQSLVDRARAGVTSGRPGQRFGSLRALREAARIRVTPEVRDLALAALVLPDVEVAAEWDAWPEGTVSIAFDGDFHNYVRLDEGGGLTLCRRAGGGEEVTGRLPPYGEPPFTRVWMSLDGSYVGYGYQGRESTVGSFRVWRVGGAAPEVVLDEPAGLKADIEFRPDSRQLAAYMRDGSIGVYDLATGRRVWRRQVGHHVDQVAFHPHDNRLAVASGGAVRIFDLASGRESPPLVQPQGVTRVNSVSWDPDGRRLAVGGDDQRIYMWDVDAARQIMTPWEGHAYPGIISHFNHAGDRLVSWDWGVQTLLWEAATGRPLLRLPAKDALRFSRDDSLLGVERLGSKLRLYRVAPGRELLVLRRRDAAPGEHLSDPQPHADGHTLAATAPDRMAFFDLDRGEEMETSPGPPVGTIRVASVRSGGWVTQNACQALLWPARPDPDRPEVLQVGPPVPLAPCYVQYIVATDRDARVVAQPRGTGALVLDGDRPGRRVALGPQYDVRYAAVSPDGRWVVTCSHFLDGNPPLRVWEAATGRHVADLPVKGPSSCTFSHDGRWLGARTEDRDVCVWEVGTWGDGRRLRGGPLESFTFSPDGRLVAAGDRVGQVRLFDPGTGREVSRLTGPEAQAYMPVCFTPDGTRLVATTATPGSLMVTTSATPGNVYVWDLLRLREGLRELGLDRDWLALPNGARPLAAGRPRRVEVRAGQLGNPAVLRHAQRAGCALALAANPLDAAANGLLGQLLLDDNQDQAARARLSLSLAVRPDHPATRWQRARAASRLGDWLAALVDLDAYLAAQPGDAEALELRARVRQRLGRFREALADWEAAAPWYTRDPEFWLGRAETYAALGRTAEAEAGRRQARAVARDHNGGVNNTAWWLASGPAGTRDAPRALRLARLAAAESDSGLNLNTLGVAEYRCGHYRKAVATLEKSTATSHGQNGAFDLFFLAMAYQRLGEVSRARDCYERAVAWLRSKQGPQWGEHAELDGFRAEAEEVLASPSPAPR